MVETNIVVTSAYSVTVSGISFGTQDMTASSRIGTTSCQTATWVSGTSATCHTSLGVGSSLAVLTTVSEIAGTQTAVFTYDGMLSCDRQGLCGQIVLMGQTCRAVPLPTENFPMDRSARGELRCRGQLGRDVGLQRDGVRNEFRCQWHHADVDDRAQQLHHGDVGINVIRGVHAQHGRGRQPRATDDGGRCRGQPHRDVQL